MEAVGEHILVKMMPESISLRKGKRISAQIRNQRERGKGYLSALRRPCFSIITHKFHPTRYRTASRADYLQA
jgi:hypothetical protein